MAITIDGQVKRNLPEQVDKNKKDIEDLQGTIGSPSFSQITGDVMSNASAASKFNEKVDKVTGMGLSEINFTHMMYDKLSSINMSTKQDKLSDAQMAAVNSGVTQATFDDVCEVAQEVFNREFKLENDTPLTLTITRDPVTKKTHLAVVGGAGVWGSITGNINSQTDLMTQLNSKIGAAALNAYRTSALQDIIDRNLDSFINEESARAQLAESNLEDALLLKLVADNIKAGHNISVSVNGNDVTINCELSAMTYKGTVTNYSDLPATASAGDVYGVTAIGRIYVRTATNTWDNIGAIIDSSNFYTKVQADEKFATKEELNAEIGVREEQDDALLALINAEVSARESGDTELEANKQDKLPTYVADKYLMAYESEPSIITLKWEGLPSNVAKLDVSQTFTENQYFTGNEGITAKFNDNLKCRYTYNAIMPTAAGTQYSLGLPLKNGTIAVTADIPDVSVYRTSAAQDVIDTGLRNSINAKSTVSASTMALVGADTAKSIDIDGNIYNFPSSEDKLPLAGGTLTGDLTIGSSAANKTLNVNGTINSLNTLVFNGNQNVVINRAATNLATEIRGSTSYTNGAYMYLAGKDNTVKGNGVFGICATNGSSSKELQGYPDGTLKWAGKKVLTEGNPLMYSRIINDDAAGAYYKLCRIDTTGYTYNNVYGMDKYVFRVCRDSMADVVITISANSSGNIQSVGVTSSVTGSTYYIKLTHNSGKICDVYVKSTGQYQSLGFSLIGGFSRHNHNNLASSISAWQTYQGTSGFTSLGTDSGDIGIL